MVYRHIYWGILRIGPDSQSMLTGAVKKRNYLLKIVTPGIYRTSTEAEGDPMEYSFHAGADDVSLLGFSRCRDKKSEKGILESLKDFDSIREGNWTRYQMIRLWDDARITPDGVDGKLCECGRVSTRKWRRIFPMIGTYPVEKCAYTIVAFPDVDKKGDG